MIPAALLGQDPASPFERATRIPLPDLGWARAPPPRNAGPPGGGVATDILEGRSTVVGGRQVMEARDAHGRIHGRVAEGQTDRVRLDPRDLPGGGGTEGPPPELEEAAREVQSEDDQSPLAEGACVPPVPASEIEDLRSLGQGGDELHDLGPRRPPRGGEGCGNPLVRRAHVSPGRTVHAAPTGIPWEKASLRHPGRRARVPRPDGSGSPGVRGGP